MADSRLAQRSLFPGLALLFVGLLLLVHNYRGLDIRHLLGHWWPLLIIFWGVIKLYERAVASRSGQASSSVVTGGEVFLVIGLLSLLGMVATFDVIKNRWPIAIEDLPGHAHGEGFNFDLNIEPKPVPVDAHITIRNAHGDISVRLADDSRIHVDGKKNINAWNERDAEHIASAISVEIAKNGDAYEVRPVSGGDSRASLNLDIAVPKKTALAVHNERGDVTVSDMDKPINVSTVRGDVEVRDTAGDVAIDTGKGDVKVSDTKGNVRISGHGGEVNVSGATGALTIDGEFFGPIRADKIAKGVRFVSKRTDLTLTQLTGHLETSSGNLEIADAPGNLTLRTNSYDISIENPGGKVKVDNRNGNIEVRFPQPPKEDIEITNSSSPITLILPESSNFEIAADCHSCDIDSEFSGDSLKQTSNSGDAHLEGKYGNGRGPKIILKTSYGSISIRKTS